MSPLEQHTAIALALGYTYEDKEITYDGEPIKFRLWRTPGGGGMEKSWPPNYPGDLNAMHEAEENLSAIQRCQFAEKLFRVLIGDDCVTEFMKIHATAEQRAEAFLRTLGLWVEGQPKPETKQ